MALPKKVQAAADNADKAHATVYKVKDIKEEVKDPAVLEAVDDDVVAKIETQVEEDAKQEANELEANELEETAALAAKEAESPLNEKDKQRYLTLKGKYDTEVPRLNTENQALHEEVNSLQRTISEFGRDAAQDVELSDEGEVLLSDEEVEEYGPELVDMISRAAKQAVSPELTQLKAENKKLKSSMTNMSNSLEKNANASIYRQLDVALPNWKKINESNEFLAWLGKNDVYSGVSRQILLTRAFEASDSARVLQFFKGYLTEQTIAKVEAPPENGLDTLIAPGRPSATDATGAATKGQIWTSAQVDAYYRKAREGKYDEATMALYEIEINAAGREGRIRN